MGRLFDSPMTVMLILVVILLLFGAPKLPGMARSLGQSMRIFKSEVKEMKKDDEANVTVNGRPVADGQTVGAAGQPAAQQTPTQPQAGVQQPTAAPQATGQAAAPAAQGPVQPQPAPQAPVVDQGQRPTA